jgi:hypothetical protein
VYGKNTHGVLELVPFPHFDSLSVQAKDMVDYLYRVHDQVKSKLKKTFDQVERPIWWRRTYLLIQQLDPTQVLP